MDSATPFQPWAVEDSSKDVKSERELADDAKLHRENVNPKHTQTASYDKGSVATASSVPGPSGAAAAGASPARDKDSKMDTTKVASMQQIVENTLSQESRQRVAQLLDAVEALSGAERLLLYLRLPTGVPPHDPLKQPINPLGSRAELQQTVTWIQTHLEVDPDVSLPKQDVYDEYIAHCMSSNMKPLSTADFGKVMKQVYPTVRPRRLGTRGNSRYCYAGLRKKIKLEVPQLPDLGESSKESSVTSRENERIICEWAEMKLGMKFSNLLELSRHLSSVGVVRAPLGPPSTSPPPPPLAQPHGEDPTSRQLMKQLKRKIQTQGAVGRPKKNKAQEVVGDSPPSTSYVSHHPPVKHESEITAEYAYQPAYVPVYDRAPYPYGVPPRAHPPPAPHPPHPHPTLEYPRDPYVFEPYPAPRDLTLPPDTAHNLPINLSSDASLDLSTEREWARRRDPPPAPPARLPLPGKKLILETYQSETRAEGRPPQQPVDFPRTEYLPKKMRAAEILGGKLAAARLAATPVAPTPAPSTSAEPPAPADPQPAPARSEAAFLDDPKNLANRSKGTAAALVREQREAASHRASKVGAGGGTGAGSDACCGLDGINLRTGVICANRHHELLSRQRVASICSIDKHDLDDYLHEGSSQEHEEELLKYFHREVPAPAPPAAASDASAPPPQPASAPSTASTSDSAPQHMTRTAFLETGLDPQDEHSQGKNEKLSQLRELLAKNLKNQSGSNPPHLPEVQNPTDGSNQSVSKPAVSEGAFKPVAPNSADIAKGPAGPTQTELSDKQPNTMQLQNGNVPFVNQTAPNSISTSASAGVHLYNGNGHTEPQSPTTRTQQYEFVPISEGCQSPGNFNSKSPLGFVQRGLSPSKLSKTVMMGGSLQTSPISHSTAASPFVSPRNTPVPRSRLCPRPIPKHNGRKRRNPLSLGVADPNSKPFVMPNDQKCMPKTSMCGPGLKYCQPMSAPPSPNIISSQYKTHMFQCNSNITNGNSNMNLNFLPNTPYREMNGELGHPLSADPLSSEVSQFFQESLVAYRTGHDNSFRSQSVPLKQGMNNLGLLSYTNTPVGSVPPTPVPNEFCDFGSLTDACDISKAGLNPETLDRIYDAIDSSNDVLNGPQNLLNSNNALSNGCDQQPMLTDDQLSSLIPTGNDQFNQTFASDNGAADNVEDFLKRANSIEFDLSELVSEKTKYYNTSRSVPSTPLPYKRSAPNLQVDSRRSRELFVADTYDTMSNGISSKSVPSTPQLADERSVFSYSNRDFLINGNSVEMCGGSQLGGAGGGAGIEGEGALGSPLHDMLREDMLDPLTPAADLLADLDKMDATPYVDL